MKDEDELQLRSFVSEINKAVSRLSEAQRAIAETQRRISASAALQKEFRQRVKALAEANTRSVEQSLALRNRIVSSQRATLATLESMTKTTDLLRLQRNAFLRGMGSILNLYPDSRASYRQFISRGNRLGEYWSRDGLELSTWLRQLALRAAGVLPEPK